MVYRGHIRNGRIELEETAHLPEGAEVEISLVTPNGSTGDQGQTLYEKLKPIIGQAQDLPPDAARNLDHYLYGLPKQ